MVDLTNATEAHAIYVRALARAELRLEESKEATASARQRVEAAKDRVERAAEAMHKAARAEYTPVDAHGNARTWHEPEDARQRCARCGAMFGHPEDGCCTPANCQGQWTHAPQRTPEEPLIDGSSIGASRTIATKEIEACIDAVSGTKTGAEPALAELRALKQCVRNQANELLKLRFDLARISDEMGLPATVGPAPGELRRLLEQLRKLVDATASGECVDLSKVTDVDLSSDDPVHGAEFRAWLLSVAQVKP